MSDQTSSTGPRRQAPDLSAFARAVRFRDRAVASATAHHERAGLRPSDHYARATFDAIAGLIREDERDRLTAAGRLRIVDEAAELARVAAETGEDVQTVRDLHEAMQACGDEERIEREANLRDTIIEIISPHASNCQDAPCTWCEDAIKRADLILKAVAEHYGDEASGRHVIEFRPDGWTLKHPLACRPDLFACPLNQVAEELSGPLAAPGRYEVELNDLGDRLLILDRIDLPEATP